MQIQQSLLSQETLWQAVLNRDPSFDNVFFYGVRSTSIYCRPICPSRKPNRNQVLFFSSCREAESAGYRPCKRCQPECAALANSALTRVLAICRYIEAEVERIPTLVELGTHVGISPTYLQRIFKQMIGVTPFQYADACRIKRLKERLQQGDTITSALYETGYGASSRLYEKAPQQLGMTPGSYQRCGRGETIRYTIICSPLGQLLVAATHKGLCSVRLGETATDLEQEFKQEFQNALIKPDDEDLHNWTQSLMNYLSGNSPLPELPLDIQASAFQVRVWEALRMIPIGTTASYSDIAQAIGQPKSVRAVAHACATNPVALVIPCHRVVQKNGGLGGYRWGVGRKKALINFEAKNI